MDEAVGALLVLGGRVAVNQVVTVQALVAANVGGVEDLPKQGSPVYLRLYPRPS